MANKITALEKSTLIVANSKALKELGLPVLVRAKLAGKPARGVAFLQSLDLVGGMDIFAPFIAAKAAGEKTVDLPKTTHKSVWALAKAFGLKGKRVEGNTAFTAWARPVASPTKAATIGLLKTAGGEEHTPGVWTIYGLDIDVNGLLIDGRAVKCITVLSACGNEAFDYLPEQALYWMVLGALQGIFEGGMPQKKFLGYIRVMYSKAHEDGGYGYKDPATNAFLESKVPVFRFGFGVTGLTMNHIGMRDGEAFATLSAMVDDLGAHAQGKFMIRLSNKSLAVMTEVVKGELLVYVASVAVAKWFKRLTLDKPLQVRPINPDVSFFRNRADAEHHGRRVEVMMVEDGLNLPYLGNMISLWPRKRIASLVSVTTDVPHSATWAGELTLEMPKVGTVVKKGDVLVAGPTPLLATIGGVIVSAVCKTPVDNKTTVEVEVTNYDRTGQVKWRAGIIKASLAYTRWLNPDWDAFTTARSIDKAQKMAGDVAILAGLLATDNPTALGSADVNKAMGTGNASGVISMAANTLGEHIVYCPKAHAEGKYDALIERFKAVAYRKNVKIAYAVLPEIAELVKKTNRTDLTFHEEGEHVIIIQTANVWVGTDVLKVESLSVRESVTTSHSPLEVAMAANAMLLKHGAEMLKEGGSAVYKQIHALHEVAHTSFNPELVEAYKAEMAAAGKPTNDYLATRQGFVVGDKKLIDSGITTVDLRKLSDTQKEKLAAYGLEPSTLAKRIAFIDTDNTTAIVIACPEVIAAFGSGDDATALKNLFAQLCVELGLGNVELGAQLIRQMAAFLRKMASSAGANKRFSKGSRAVHAKTSAGNVPQGWVAMGYNSTVALRLVELFGLNSVDDLWGRVVYCYRSPQTAPLPLRLYFPDAPEDLLRHNAAVLPQGSSFLKQIPMLEPDRFFLSPVDTAFDQGDHDGDGRYLIAVTCMKAHDEALAFIAQGDVYRQAVLAAYMAKVEDPAVAAFKHENPKKLKWASVGVKTYKEFVDVSVMSIENQTKQIGQAYEYAHVALVAFGDLTPSMENAHIAHAFFVGHYEEQLAGLDEVYFRLYTLLLDDSPYRDEYGQLDVVGFAREVKTLNEKLGHTGKDTRKLLEMRALYKNYKAVGRGGEATLEGANLVRSLIAGLTRELSKGLFTREGKVSTVFQGILAAGGPTLVNTIKAKASTSVACFALDRFLTNTYPLIVANCDMEGEGEGAEHQVHETH